MSSSARGLCFIVAGCFVLAAAGCSSEIDDADLPIVPGFSMKDELMCTVARSSNRSDVGKVVTLIGLSGPDIKVVFEGGNRSPMKKVYETDKTIVLQLIATASGSVDSFVIDKATGKFSRATAGSFVGVYATASVGTCT